MWIRIIELAQEHDSELYPQVMGYPDDLPDLSTCSVPTNAKGEGLEQSAYARRQRGELLETYLF